jgi:hypothetical protein
MEADTPGSLQVSDFTTAICFDNSPACQTDLFSVDCYSNDTDQSYHCLLLEPGTRSGSNTGSTAVHYKIAIEVHA